MATTSTRAGGVLKRTKAPVSATHESLDGHHQVRLGSDRTFGLVIGAVFLIIAMMPFLKGGEPRWWAIAPAAALLGLAVIRPAVLHPLNKVWFRFGVLLHTLLSPMVLGLLFFGVVTPMALIMRMAGNRQMDIGFDPSRSSYWIERDPAGPAPNSMQRQF